jgi:hypothetical protein
MRWSTDVPSRLPSPSSRSSGARSGQRLDWHRRHRAAQPLYWIAAVTPRSRRQSPVCSCSPSASTTAARLLGSTSGAGRTASPTASPVSYGIGAAASPSPARRAPRRPIATTAARSLGNTARTPRSSTTRRRCAETSGTGARSPGFDRPGAAITTALGVNNHMQVVCQYFDATGEAHGYLWQRGRYTTIDLPGAAVTIDAADFPFTFPWGIKQPRPDRRAPQNRHRSDRGHQSMRIPAGRGPVHKAQLPRRAKNRGVRHQRLRHGRRPVREPRRIKRAR